MQNNDEPLLVPEPKKVKWYFKPAWIIVAILAVGPLALPLILLSPELKPIHKIGFTILIVLLTIWLYFFTVKTYEIVKEQMKAFEQILNT